MVYDNLHNIVSKKQHVQQSGIQFDGILKAGYDLEYNYADNPFQISNLKDDSYRTESDTIANDVIKRNHAYEYDANGNLVYVNTLREKQDGSGAGASLGRSGGASQEKKMVWDEENRLQSIYTNGFIAGYWYDASGERVIKTSGDDEGIYVNDVFSGGRTETADFTAYINPYLVVSKGGSYTKHIYIGSQRIVSKLGDLDSYGQDPRRIEYAGSNVDGAKVDYKSKYVQSQQAIKDNYANFEVPYYGTDNDDYVNGEGFCCDNTRRLKSFDPGKNDNSELFQYYYHSDHLGSSSLITNLDGEVVQHVEYIAFGEVFIEERNNTWNTPYLFNSKELDPETSLYYYGSRYYDPRISLWLSADPLQEKYPNKTPYHYCSNNPVNFIDSDGKDDYLDKKGNKVYNDGQGDGLRLVDKEVFKSLEKEVNQSMKGMTFKNKDAKNQYKQQQLRNELRNGTDDSGVANSRVITINGSELVGLPSGYTNSVDYIYALTNDRKANPGAAFEYYINIILDVENATISFSGVGKVKRNGGGIATQVGITLLANIHGHPDQLENRADGAFHTLRGQSEADKNAARTINGPIYNIENGSIYYYGSYSNSDHPSQYTGPRDAKSIIRHAVDLRLNP